MRAVIQRVSGASVSAEGGIIGHIGRGLLVLLAIHADDEEGKIAEDADMEAKKLETELAQVKANTASVTVPPVPQWSQPVAQPVATTATPAPFPGTLVGKL